MQSRIPSFHSLLCYEGSLLYHDLPPPGLKDSMNNNNTSRKSQQKSPHKITTIPHKNLTVGDTFSLTQADLEQLTGKNCSVDVDFSGIAATLKSQASRQGRGRMSLIRSGGSSMCSGTGKASNQKTSQICIRSIFNPCRNGIQLCSN